MGVSEVQTAAVQRTAAGELLGICIAIPAKIVELYADRENIKFEITDTKEGDTLEGGGYMIFLSNHINRSVSEPPSLSLCL